MKNIALVLAGGRGTRIESTIPKQFIEVVGKPIIIHTLEKLINTEIFDKIYIACVKEYIEYLQGIIKDYTEQNIIILEGGQSAFYSNYNGIKKIYQDNKEDCNVLIHDANRPLVTEKHIRDIIRLCNKYEQVVTVTQSTELIMVSDNGKSSSTMYNRDKLYRIQKPECYKLKKLYKLYEKAIKDKRDNYVATCDLYNSYGEKLHFCNCEFENIKITYNDDLRLLKELLKEGEQHEKD